MKLGVTSKLFLAIVATCIVVAVAMSVAIRASFQWGFLGYLNEVERQRLVTLSEVLSEVYQEHGSWDFLRGNHREWWRLAVAAERSRRLAQEQEEGRAGHHARHAEGMPRLRLRMSVLDGDRRSVVGNPHPPPDAMERPIVVGGRTVGYVLSVPLRRLSSAADVEFQEQQLKASWVIGLLAVVLAAGVAVWLARSFLKPTRRLAEATHRLAAGDYATRVPVTSSDELGQLAEDFNRLAGALERNERMRRNFMADVSHELRTPLAVLRGELEAMEDGLQPLNPQSLQSLRAEVDTLTKLVGDIYELSLADVGALAYRKEPLDLRTLLERVAAGFRERLAARAIAIVWEPGTEKEDASRVWGDSGRLTQLFNNIFENSVRYTESGGRVHLACRRRGDWVEVDVHDTGPGVPPEMLPRLFERFYRADGSRNRATGGAGLGLAICRSIVEAHDGRIEAKSSPKGGLWLAMVLPAEGAAAGREAHP